MDKGAYGLTRQNFCAVLPPALRQDSRMEALSEAVAEALQARAEEIRRATVYLRIDSLPEDLLDILAYDFKVDWWDGAAGLEEKRRTLRSAFRVHRTLGTRAAVERAISAVYPGRTRAEEWFEYDGQPYRFRLVCDVTETGLDAGRMAEVTRRIGLYGNLRSHLEGVRYVAWHDGAAFLGGAAASADVRMGERTMDANLRISISAVQPGTGDPAPDNPRPILPGLTLVRDDETVLEVYGGTLDTASGVLTVTHRAVDLDGTESWILTWTDTEPAFFCIISNTVDGVNNSGVFSRFLYGNIISASGAGARCYVGSGANYRILCRYEGQPETTTDWKAMLAEWAEDGKPLQVVYPLETPVTIQLTEAEIKRARLTRGCVVSIPEDEEEG